MQRRACVDRSWAVFCIRVDDDVARRLANHQFDVAAPGQSVAQQHRDQLVPYLRNRYRQGREEALVKQQLADIDRAPAGREGRSAPRPFEGATITHRSERTPASRGRRALVSSPTRRRAEMALL